MNPRRIGRFIKPHIICLYNGYRLYASMVYSIDNHRTFQFRMFTRRISAAH